MLSIIIKVPVTQNNASYNSFRISVPPAFKEVISHFYFAENRSGEAVTKTLLPSYQTILVFHFGGKATLSSKHVSQIEIEKCIVLGPVKQPFDYCLWPGAEILVANFIDDGFYRFFGNASVAESLPVHPDDLLNENCFTRLWTSLNHIPNVYEKVNFTLAFCEPYLKERNILIAELMKYKDAARDPIKSVAAKFTQSERSIQINHKKQLGFSAKELSRYQRFLKATELIQRLIVNTNKVDWFEIVAECGYYDQSQLIHDFRHYLHLSPTKYLQFQKDICSARS